MKILLIYPYAFPQKNPKIFWVPLGLSFIASVLKKEGHTLSIFDRFSTGAMHKEGRAKLNYLMLEHIRTFQPDLIGLNTISPLIYDTAESAEIIRTIYPGALIAGGHHATALPGPTLRKIPELNGIVEGEGEMAMLGITRNNPPTEVPGVWWKNDAGTVTHRPPKQLQHLDNLPFPSLDLLDMNFYKKPSLNSIRGYHMSVVPILTSRGCAQCCDFCSESLTYGRGVRFHSPEYVTEWMEEVWLDYKPEGIYFHDNDFLIDENRAHEICESILSRHLHKRMKWAIQARANSISEETLRLLKRAGCILIELGVESAIQGQLDGLHKGTTVAMNERAITLCRKEGISVHAFMMTGFEGETLSDLEKGLQWVKRIKPNSFSWFPLAIHPGTVLYQKRGRGFFEKKDWTADAVQAYYQKDDLSQVPKKERSQWMSQSFLPYQKWQHRLNILRINPPLKLLLLFTWKAKEALRDFVRCFRKG